MGAAAATDLYGDGNLDLVVANQGSAPVLDVNDDSSFRTTSGLSLLRGNGDGTFQPAVRADFVGEPGDMAFGDVNGDGKVDLVVTNPGNDDLTLLLGNGDGTFQPPRYIATSFATTFRGVALADLKGDGKLDIVITDLGNGGEVSILFGNGDGTFQKPVHLNAGGLGGGDSITVADVNNDG